MQAVILAAGVGSRMGEEFSEVPKGLIKVAGREIIYRTLIFLKKAGITNFIIVANENAAAKYEEFMKKHKFGEYKIVINKYPQKGNGYSLYLAKDFIESQRFVLIMSDHIYEEAFVKEAVKKVGLIYDKVGKYIDPDEATKIKLSQDKKIEQIGKKLANYDGFDTGFFVLDKEIFVYAEKLQQNQETIELSQIIQKAHIEASELSGYLWMDVDTPQELKVAKKHIIKHSVKSVGDGFISRLINRRISTKITEAVIDKLTPNQATILTFLFGVFAAMITVISTPLGGIMYQISSILDGVDGEIARASLRTSKIGGWIDSILDRVVDFLFILALSTKLPPYMWNLVATAVFTSTMVSYTTERYKAAMGKDAYEHIPQLRFLIGKRDERIFIAMLFCLFNKVLEFLLLIVAITTLRIVLTIYFVYRYHKHLETE